MKLTANTPEGGIVELDVKKYPMPVKGVAGTAKINGEDTVTMFTSGRGNSYTYFRLKNVDLYVAGALDPEVAYEVELPEDFGSDTEPAARKSYYVRKRPAKPGEGEVPLGGNEPTGGVAAETDPETGERVIPETVEGVDPSSQPDNANDPAGNPIDEEATATAAPKSRRKGK